MKENENSMSVTSDAFILHRFAYQDADLILKVLTKNQGIISVLAKGVRRSKAKTQGCFEPFVPLEISYLGKSDLKKLKSVEMRGCYFTLKAEALYAAFYLNELLLNLIPSNFSSGHSLEGIFEDYENTLSQLSSNLNLTSNLSPELALEQKLGQKIAKINGAVLEVILRKFEINLLTLLGVWPDFSRDDQGDLVDPESFYELMVENLPKKITDLSLLNRGFRGEILLGLAFQQWEYPGVLSAAKKLLRHWISFYCGGKPFKSRECFALI